MNEEFTPLSVGHMHLDLAHIVRDVEKETRVASWKEVLGNAPRVVTKNLSIGERAIDRRAHGAEIALPCSGLHGFGKI
jgi:hypothetical protein